jgi:hypothetical protein
MPISRPAASCRVTPHLIRISRIRNNRNLDMKPIGVVDRAAAVLNNLDVNKMWNQPPEVSLIPFTQAGDVYFLLISLCLSKKFSALADIEQACLSTISCIGSSRVAENLPAFQIAPFILDKNSKTGYRRVLRLTVRQGAYKHIPDFRAVHLHQPEPFEGLSCTWFLETSELFNS